MCPILIKPFLKQKKHQCVDEKKVKLTIEKFEKLKTGQPIKEDFKQKWIKDIKEKIWSN